jgi:hypothetical protein
MTRAETRFRLSAKRTGQFKSAGASVQSTTGSRNVRIGGSNAGHTMFQGSVKSTGYTLHSPVYPSLPLPCVQVCHHIACNWTLNLSHEKSPHRMPKPFDSPCFHRLGNIRRPVQITKSLITQFSPASSYYAPLCPNIPLNTLFSELKVTDHTSHPHKAANLPSNLYTPLLTFKTSVVNFRS